MLVKIQGHLIETQWIYKVGEVTNKGRGLEFTIYFVNNNHVLIRPSDLIDRPIVDYYKLSEDELIQLGERFQKEIHKKRDELIRLWQSEQSIIPIID